MRLITANAEIVVNLPLAETEPWPGLASVAVMTPVFGGVLLMSAFTGLVGWLAPWLVGATPVLVLFLPLIYVIRRTKPGSATLVLEDLVLRVVHHGRAPVFDASSLRAAVAWNRLSLEGPSEKMEIDLRPLDNQEVHELRRVLRELVDRADAD